MEKNTSSEHRQQNRGDGDEHKEQSNHLLVRLRHGVTNT